MLRPVRPRRTRADLCRVGPSAEATIGGSRCAWVCLAFISDVAPIPSDNDPGDPHMAAELLPLVHIELRMLAAARMALEGSGHPLQPAALVDEAFLRLVAAQKQQD